jgi:Tfp pilus assembly protein PilO
MKLFEEFEIYLKKVQLTQKIMIFLMPIILIGGIVFMYLTPMQEEELDMLDSENTKLHANIKRKQPRVVKKKIKKAETTLLTLKEIFEENHDALNYLYAKLTNMEVLEFNEQQWTVTLDEILKKSLKLNIKIKHIKNSDSELKEGSDKIVPKKYVEIIGSGKYSDTLKYLHFIENRQFLVDVKNIKMKKQEDSKKIDFHFNFTIYGVNL